MNACYRGQLHVFDVGHGSICANVGVPSASLESASTWPQPHTIQSNADVMTSVCSIIVLVSCLPLQTLRSNADVMTSVSSTIVVVPCLLYDSIEYEYHN